MLPHYMFTAVLEYKAWIGSLLAVGFTIWDESPLYSNLLLSLKFFECMWFSGPIILSSSMEHLEWWVFWCYSSFSMMWSCSGMMESVIIGCGCYYGLMIGVGAVLIGSILLDESGQVPWWVWKVVCWCWLVWFWAGTLWNEAAAIILCSLMFEVVEAVAEDVFCGCQLCVGWMLLLRWLIWKC